MAEEHSREKVAFILIDGIGDVSIPSLGYTTPLEVAHTPVLDAIAGETRTAHRHHFARHLQGLIPRLQTNITTRDM